MRPLLHPLKHVTIAAVGADWTTLPSSGLVPCCAHCTYNTTFIPVHAISVLPSS